MPRRPAVLLTSPRSTSASPLACPELRRVHSPYTSFVYKNEAHPLSPQPLPHSYTKTPGCHHQRFPISPLVHPQAKQDCHAPVAQGGVRAALRFFPRRFASLPPRTLPPPRTALAEDGGMLPPALTTEIAHQPARHSTPSHPRGRRSPQRQPPILASPRRRGPVGCPPTNLASTFQPLSSPLPRLRHLHRGRQPRRPRLIPAPILRLLRRSFPHLQPGHPPVALLRHPLARRRPQCPAGRLRPLAGSALHPSAAHRRLLSRPSAAAQLSHQFEFLRQPDHAGHSRPAPVSRHLSPGIRPRHPLPCRALGTNLDRLVGRGVSCHAPDFSHRPLRTSRCAVTSSAPIAPPPESCRRSNDYHSAGCLRAGGAARLPLRRAFAQWRSPAISDRSHHCRRSRALVSRAPLSRSEVCTVRLRSQSSDGLRRIHLGSRRNLGKRLRGNRKAHTRGGNSLRAGHVPRVSPPADFDISRELLASVDSFRFCGGRQRLDAEGIRDGATAPARALVAEPTSARGSAVRVLPVGAELDGHRVARRYRRVRRSALLASAFANRIARRPRTGHRFRRDCQRLRHLRLVHCRGPLPEPRRLAHSLAGDCFALGLEQSVETSAVGASADIREWLQRDRPFVSRGKRECLSYLSGGFGAEDALKARASELHTDEALAVGRGVADVHDAALCGEIALQAARGVVRNRDANLQIGTEGDVKAREERGPVAAQILARGFFLEHHAAAVAAAHFERQTHRNPTLGPLFRYHRRDGRARLDHGPGPLFLRRLGPRKSVLRFRELHWAFAPHVRFCEVRCRSPRNG